MFVTKWQIAVVQNSDNYPLRNHFLKDNRSGFPHSCVPDSDLFGVLLTIAYLTIIPRARMGSESIAHEAKGKIQLVGQKYRE